MKQADRIKVCLSCEADVNIDATYCPFCGADLMGSSSPSPKDTLRQDEKFTTQSLQESLASLYKPPYSVRNSQGFGIPDEREQDSFQEMPTSQEHVHVSCYKENENLQNEETEKLPQEEKGGLVFPLFLLSLGVDLLVLGLFLLFFSKDGVVTLEWKSSFWFLYFLIGAPLIVFGVRILKKRPL